MRRCASDRIEWGSKTGGGGGGECDSNNFKNKREDCR